ncbi:MAG TPA: alpha-L-fucosidase [Prolixibacteraceae bacterium]|nr:alpha-L-fucosidase [Prolixibacteraceae bacterium]
MKQTTILAILLSLTFVLRGQENYQPSPENLKAREWFQDAKFGLFIHWGVYSVLGDGEWVMHQQQFDKKSYEKLPAFFNPISFDAAEWVKMAKEAGMKYITITSKHHDGFCMWDTKLTDWNIVQRTPYGKDVLKQLADECHKAGIRLFFYHSHLDWYQENYYPRGGTGGASGRPDKGNWYAYLDYMDAQLTELLTNYGEIAGIWFDGWWDRKDADWRLDKTYSLIHRLQPAALVGNNHHQAPKPGEDFQMFEKDLPGQNTTGFSGESKVGALPLETCETMNGSWGFNIRDKNYKTPRQLIQYLVKASGYGANFLLNTGPMPNGKIQPENVATLKEMGKWLEKYGETVYGTRKGPVEPADWGVTTHKGNKIYIHLLNLKGENLLIPALPSKIKSAVYFDGGEKVRYRETEYGLLLHIPQNKQDAVDTILTIEV